MFLFPLEFTANVAILYLLILATAVTVKYLRRNPKKQFEEEIRRLREQLKTYQELLEAREKECKARIKEISERAVMLEGLNTAIKSGKVKLKCAQHDADVTVLVDGTIICSEGHRIWPPSEEK